MSDDRVPDFTPGAEWRVVGTQDVGERTRRLEFLFKDGYRRTVNIDVASDNEETRAKLADALRKPRGFFR